MTRAAKAAAQTPQARLASVIKSSRDIMRKDAGLNGDLDRLPQLSWLLFLKAFDDLEQNRMIVDPGYRPALPEELRAVGLARLVNPSASLAELASLTDPPLAKSTVHRRLARLRSLLDG